ncbi:membrane protease subunit [Sphingobium yanoikuyae]|uniref:membrane protease subunit n=1 Tax=Sphingobium yanoikuyae TaxID=13690 RepID=UPI0022DD9B26|nr:membrane protease subunit [Sphingobium yanoikuyae]WBQ16346.1 membrane protease subunit [Sphingobium yanoikuyae]
MVRLTGTGILGLALLIGVTLSGILWGCPSYNVYSKEQAGRAALAEAQSSRQIAVLEARAKLESAKMLADAEVVRAEGAARANRILQDSLGGPDGYLRYLQIQAIDNKDASLIYVPTEGGLPLLESSRLAPRAPGEAN